MDLAYKLDKMIRVDENLWINCGGWYLGFLKDLFHKGRA